MLVYFSGEGTTAPPEIVFGKKGDLMISVEFIIINSKHNQRGKKIHPDLRFRRIIESRTKK